jgi:predicted nucleic acid-binding protein
MPSIIVSDTSCLILFYKIGELDLLKKLFGKLHITETVLKEFNQQIPDWIEVVELTTDLQKGLSSYLDKGEATAISLAAEHENSLLIIDEIKGRKAAKEMGISVTGSLGVLIAAKNKGHIQTVKPLIERIQKTNFRISEELIEQVLDKVNES